jgi:hypothetical protein
MESKKHFKATFIFSFMSIEVYSFEKFFSSGIYLEA